MRPREDEERSRSVEAAHSQALFREVNERIEELGKHWTVLTEFVCECADRSCNQPISVAVEEYDAVRGDPGSFLVAPGHEVLDVEEVVRRTDRYTVVRKVGAGYAVAAESDPRTR